MSCIGEVNPFDREWKAGDSEEIVINYLNPDRTPVDLTGAVAKMQLRRKAQDVSSSLEIIGLVTLDTGKIEFFANPTDTRALLISGSKTKYVYDIQIDFDANNIKTIAAGTITAVTDITR